MPKKLKLKLEDLKIQSFVTLLTEDEKKKFKGGGSVDCDSTHYPCCHTTFEPTCRPSYCSGEVCC